MGENKTVLEDVLFKVEIKEDERAKREEGLDLFLIKITEGHRTHHEYGFIDEDEAKNWIRYAVSINYTL